MEKISTWASQLIVAVIIVTIIEMILPKGNNKKYIKIVLSIYIIFAILSPIATNAFQENLSFNIKKYDETLEQTEEYKTLSKKFEESTSISLEDTYKTAIKQDIQTKLKTKGYKVTKINLTIDLKSEDNYGAIVQIDISAYKGEIEENKKENIININKVEIGKENISKQKNNLTEIDKAEIANFLIQEYGIDQNNINIE